MVLAIIFSTFLVVSFSKVRHHQISKNHHDQQPVITSSAFQQQYSQNYLKEGRFCALADVWEYTYNDVLKIKQAGVNFPISIKNIPVGTSSLCIINILQGNQTFFEFINVKVNFGDVIFQEAKIYKDYGSSTPVLSQFQKKNNLTAGYLGPINYYGYGNIFAGVVGKAQYLPYDLYVYFLTTNLVEFNAKESQKDNCQTLSTGNTYVQFLSKSSYFLLLTIILNVIITLL